MTLKALTYAPTGGILAAATTSLSEGLRGGLNWDYRFCWLRDASFTLRALLDSGYQPEGRAWRDWVLRAAAGDPSELQVVYGAAGERRLPETTGDWLPGYEGTSPWVAMDRRGKETEQFGLKGPVDRWRRLRDKIHETVCREGYDDERGAFVQSFGSTALDASLLMIPIIGFLPPDDARVRNTVQAIERELMMGDGLLHRHESHDAPSQGVFIACSFWLADNYALMGRQADAERLFERLLQLCNDVGLLSEEYHAKKRRLLGNFPQALSHLSLVNTAHIIQRAQSII